MPVVGPDGQSVESAQIQQRTAELNQQAAAMQTGARALKATAGSGSTSNPKLRQP
jgi:pyruvate/2-oxoacid:ferredoxin oxidoreductase alpha subunit